MNGISNSASLNTALLQGLNEQISETSKSEKGEATKEVQASKAGLEALGQNQVSTSDMEGVQNKVTVNDLTNGTPVLGNPDKQAGDDVGNGKGSKLFGEMSGTGMILELMLETLQSGNESRTLQRQVSTTQQNASIQEGMNQVDKMMQSADKTRMGAIAQGVVGGLGTGMSLGGLAGMNSKINSALTGKTDIGNKQQSLQNKLQDNLGKQAGLVGKDFKAQRQGNSSGLTGAEKQKLNNLKAKAEVLQSKLDAIKDPTSSKAKELQQAKSDNIKAAMEAFSGVTNTVNSGVQSGMQADAATLNARGQLDNLRAETMKTDRSKAEGQYESSKATITSLMRVMGDILQALNSSASAAARA